MKNKYKKFLVVSTIFIIFGGFYLYYSNEVKSEKIVPVAYGSSLVSSSDAESSPVASLGDKINSDISFLASLVSLKKINIDTTLFTNKSFNSLVNNSVKLDPVSPGRQNPFAPMMSGDSSGVGSPLSKVVTDQATQITATSVALNGVVNVVNESANAYFKYGTTKDLGITTAVVKQSLVGTFIKNVSGLNPKTNYFYKACAKISGVEACGEIVSFTTN